MKTIKNPPTWRVKFIGAVSPVSHHLPQHCLYFFPLPQVHGSLRPTLGPVSFGFGLGFERSSAAWLTTSLDLSDLSGVFLSSKGLGGGWCKVCCGALRRKFSNASMEDALRKT